MGKPVNKNKIKKSHNKKEWDDDLLLVGLCG